MKIFIYRIMVLTMILIYLIETYSFICSRATKVEAVEIQNSNEVEKLLIVPLPGDSVYI